MSFALSIYLLASPCSQSLGRKRDCTIYKHNFCSPDRRSARHKIESIETMRPSASNNLGALESLVGDPAISDNEAQSYWQALSDSSSMDLGPQVDGGAAFASVALLVLLLALSGNRILGLEQRVGEWLRYMAEQKRYRDRNQTIAAREMLERQFGQEEEGGGK